MFNDYVVKHDDFIKLTNSFRSIGEYRAINCCLNLLDTEKLLVEGLAYPVDVTRYATLSGLHYSKAYNEVIEILFNTKDMFFKELVIDVELRTIKVIWLPYILPLISGEMEAKTFIKSKLIMDSTSSYRHYRLYEYIQKYLKLLNLRGEIRLFTTDLREVSKCTEVYPTYKEYSRSILKPFLTTLGELLNVNLAIKGSRREVTIMKK